MKKISIFMKKNNKFLYFHSLAILFFLGCTNKIGDPCTTDASCGIGRRCDQSSKEGYCTITPCNEKTCPSSESICVTFENEATACMATCSETADCREGYYCDTSTSNEGFCRNHP
jgi:hypothetical protein